MKSLNFLTSGFRMRLNRLWRRTRLFAVFH